MHRSILALIALIVTASCAPARAVTRQSVSAAAITVSVSDFGAIGDGIADDRAAIQAALNAAAGGTVTIPIGTYRLGKGAGFWNLMVPPGTAIVGESRDRTVLIQAAGMSASVRILEIDGVGVRVSNLTLDGNRAAQDPGGLPDGHRAATFVRAAGAVFTDVIAQNFTGDGFYFYAGGDDFRLIRVVTSGNVRNGVTLGGTITTGLVLDSVFRGNGAQQFDSEVASPGHVDGIVLRGNTFDGDGVSNDYVLTICGSAGAQSTGWVVTGNVINGGVYTVWATDISIAGNTGTNSSTKPNVTIYRTGARIGVDHNVQASAAGSAAVAITGTGTGQAATDVAVTNNRFTLTGDVGITVSGAVAVEIGGNTLTNTRGHGAVAIALRATDQATPFASALVGGNTATGWDRGLTVSGNVAARMLALAALGNTLGAPYILDDGTGALGSALIGGAPAPEVQRWPQNATLASAGGITVMWR